MVLSDIASIATAISGLAVTASPIYVGIQTEQNVRHTRDLVHQGTAALRHGSRGTGARLRPS